MIKWKEILSMFTPIRSPNLFTKPYVNCDKKQKLHKLKNPVVKGPFFLVQQREKTLSEKKKGNQECVVSARSLVSRYIKQLPSKKQALFTICLFAGQLHYIFCMSIADWLYVTERVIVSCNRKIMLKSSIYLASNMCCLRTFLLKLIVVLM